MFCHILYNFFFLWGEYLYGAILRFLENEIFFSKLLSFFRYCYFTKKLWGFVFDNEKKTNSLPYWNIVLKNIYFVIYFLFLTFSKCFSFILLRSSSGVILRTSVTWCYCHSWWFTPLASSALNFAQNHHSLHLCVCDSKKCYCDEHIGF